MASRNPLKHFIETQVFAVTVFSKESIDLYIQYSSILDLEPLKRYVVLSPY